MKYNKIDNTGLNVSSFGFGTSSLHHLFFRKDRLKILDTAYAIGINHFDTSPYYGNGLAELDLGHFLADKRHKCTLATKVGLYPYLGSRSSAFTLWMLKAGSKVAPRLSLPIVNWSVKRASASLNQSLKRCKTSYMDILFLHEPNVELIETDEFRTWLERERSEGKLRYWGLAGSASQLSTWMDSTDTLTDVLQTRDTISKHDADFIFERGRCLQFTYGYFKSKPPGISEKAFIKKLLSRNPGGSILFSSKSIDRIKEFQIHLKSVSTF